MFGIPSVRHAKNDLGVQGLGVGFRGSGLRVYCVGFRGLGLEALDRGLSFVSRVSICWDGKLEAHAQCYIYTFTYTCT